MLTLLKGLTTEAVFVQERPYDWGWGMHPMGWMGGMWGHWHDVYDVAFLVSRHCGFDTRRPVVPERSEDRPGNDSALEILRQRNAGWMGLDRWLLPAIGTPWRAGTLFRGSKTVKAT